MTEILVKPESSSHWYTRDGKPMYEVGCKSKPGTMRSTTLADARKLDLVPSVTSILQVVAKPGLETWKQSQCIEAALTLPRVEGESLDDFAKRVVLDAAEHSKTARELGTRVHAACEDWMKTTAWPHEPDVDLMVKAFSTWFFETVKAESIEVEVPVVSRLGFGGKIDLFADLMEGVYSVVDIKTQATKPSKPFNEYPEWGMQLAAYEKAYWPLNSPPPKCVLLNVILSTTEPGRIEIVDWTDKRDDCWEAFNAAFVLWRHLKGYDPRKK